MSGETDLNILLKTLSVKLWPDTYVFVALGNLDVPANIKPRMLVQEAEGTTLICTLQEAKEAKLDFEFTSRMITLNVHSALEAVGFIAKISNVLAAAGMGVNPIAGFYHDHLFVPHDRGEEAVALLDDLVLNMQASS